MMDTSSILLRAEGFFQSVSGYVNTIIIALVIVLFGFIIGKMVEKILRSIFAKMNVDDRLAKFFGARRNYARAIRRTIVRTIYIVTIIIALDRLSVLNVVFISLLVLILVVVLISLWLAGLELVPNIIARSELHRKHIVTGDDVTVLHGSGVIRGIIVDITLTDVRMKRRNGDVFYIPNAMFLSEAIVKKKLSGDMSQQERPRIMKPGRQE